MSAKVYASYCAQLGPSLKSAIQLAFSLELMSSAKLASRQTQHARPNWKKLVFYRNARKKYDIYVNSIKFSGDGSLIRNLNINITCDINWTFN